MSDTDSFIDEVSEELRRDQLFKLFKKWGWIPILVVVGIVGGAAYLEVRKSQAEAEAQAFGDALVVALDRGDSAARIAALEEVEGATPEAAIILAMMAAAEAAGADDAADAAARLRAAADAPDLARLYRDLALLKAEMLDPGPEDTSRAVLEDIATPGAPYAPLAEEQLALLEVRAGDLDAALDRLRAIERSAAATPGLQQRAAQLIVALESGAVLLDTTPEPEVAEETPDAAEEEDEPAEAEPEAPEPEDAPEPDAEPAPDAEATE